MSDHLYISAWIFLAGICAYSAIQHGSQEHQPPERRLHLLFSAIALMVALFTLTNIPVFQATTLAVYLPALRINLAIGILLHALLPWFWAEYSGIRLRWVLGGFCGLFALLFVVNLIQPYTLLYENVQGLGHLTLPWGEQLTRPQATSGPWGLVTFAAVFLVLAFAFYAAVARFRRTGGRAVLIMTSAMGFILISTILGLLTRLGIIELMPLGAFGYLGMIAVMGMTLNYEMREEQRKADKAVRESEQRFRLLIESAPEAIFVQSQDCFVYLNPPMLRLLGASKPEELLGMDFMTRMAPEFRAAIRDRIRFQRETGKTAPLAEQEYLRLDGARVPVETAAVAIRFQGRDANLVFVRDITERKQAEETLRESEAKLRAIFESSRDAIGLSKRGIHIFANPAYLALFGYQNNEALVGTSILNHIAPSHRQQVLDLVTRRAAGEQITTLYETRGMKACGAEFDMEVSISTYETQGEIYSVATIRDITERKRNQALLIETEKLRTVAGLAAGVAHEINSPLGSMVQNAQVVAARLTHDLDANQQAAQRQGTSLDAVRGYVRDRGIAEMLESIRRSGEGASQIVRNLLTYSRRDAGTSQVDLRELVEQTLQLAASDFDLKQFNGLAGVEIVRQFAADTPVIACNPAQIHQVLLNLIRNAVQALHAPAETGPRRLYLRTSRQADFGCIEVEDNGPGIAPELRPRLFEPFVTTKPVGQGTGLGLFVCYHLVTVTHGGQLSVTSIPGKQTCFTVRLPLQSSQGVVG